MDDYYTLEDELICFKTLSKMGLNRQFGVEQEIENPFHEQWEKKRPSI